MRIALVSEHASPLAAIGGVDAGGQNVHVAALAAALARCGAEVVVHTRRDDLYLPRRVPLAPGVVVEHVNAGPPAPISKDELLPFMDAFAEELHRSWMQERPEVVHSHFWMSGRAAIAAAEPLAIPVAHTYHALGTVKRRHQGRKDTSPRARIAEERAIAAHADQIIATCSDEVTELCRMDADPERITVIPCGVDLDTFHPHGPAEPRDPDRHRLLVLGRLVERKGVDDVIRALATLDGAELVVAGGPPAGELGSDAEAARLLDLAVELGVADRMELRGQVQRAEVPPLIRSADLVVCAPWYEPFGIVPVEAMACGVPVVATAVGGMLDTVVDGRTGLHVPPRDPAALGAAARALLDAPARRRRIGRAGAARAQRRYGWDRIAADTLGVYRRLAAPARLTGAAR